MKRIRMLLVGSAAALVVMGVAAIPASATQVCTANQVNAGAACNVQGFLYGTDVNANDKLSGHLATGTSNLSNSGIVTISCSSSSVAGNAHADGTSGSITTLKFPDPTAGTCTQGALSCVVTTSTPYTATASTVGGQTWDGTITVNIPATGSNPGPINVNCGSGTLNCNVHGTATGLLYNTANANAPVASAAYAQANFTTTSGSVLSGCGVGADTYTADYEVDPTVAGAGGLYIG